MPKRPPRGTRGAARAAALALTAALLAACGRAHPAPAPAGATLKDAFRGAFLVGVAVNPRQFSGADTAADRLIVRQFNAIAPENALKWALVHPEPDRYDFAGADQYVAFGAAHGMFVHGHTLVWHSQTPRWVFQDSAGQPLTRDALLARMRDHIATVVGRYRGRVGGWDVVNEALNEDGTLRDSPWRRIIGDDYLVQAFRYAHEADPTAQLYYNDYNLETPAKRDGAIRLVQTLLAAGVPVAAIGTQDHHHLDSPSAALIDTMLTRFAALGVHVNVSELDVDVLPPAVRGNSADVSQAATYRAAQDPYVAGLPDSVQRALAARYAEIFRVYLAHRDAIDRVTFWGATDAVSWLNNFPVRGRTNHPLLFDRAGRPKPAFDAVIETARAAAGR